jgi:hypothetical protein
MNGQTFNQARPQFSPIAQIEQPSNVIDTDLLSTLADRYPTSFESWVWIVIATWAIAKILKAINDLLDEG